MDFTRKQTVLDLDNIRESLIRMEDTIVFDLIERAQFYEQKSIYDTSKLSVPGFDRCFLDWVIVETEKVHSKIRRYEATDEIAFFPDEVEKTILPPLNLPPVLAYYHKEINVNDEIKRYYVERIVPTVSAAPGEQPENHGSVAITDLECLQAISRRVHFGKFVAESKFQTEPERFGALIRAQDAKGIDDAITNSAVEKKVLERIASKTDTYSGPSLRWSQKVQGKLTGAIVGTIYKELIIPLTKKVEVDYLLRRLD